MKLCNHHYSPVLSIHPGTVPSTILLSIPCPWQPPLHFVSPWTCLLCKVDSHSIFLVFYWLSIIFLSSLQHQNFIQSFTFSCGFVTGNIISDVPFSGRSTCISLYSYQHYPEVCRGYFPNCKSLRGKQKFLPTIFLSLIATLLLSVFMTFTSLGIP